MGTWAGELGLPPDQFWRQTPHTFSAIVEGATRKADRERREGISLAWHVEAFARQKRLPPLERVLRPRPQKRAKDQTMEQQISIAKAWAAALSRK